MYTNTTSVAYYGIGNPCPLYGDWPKEVNHIEDLDFRTLLCQVNNALGGHPPQNAKLLLLDALVVNGIELLKERIVFFAKGVHITWTKQ